MKRLFGDYDPEILEKTGNHIQKAEMFAPVIRENQTEEEPKAVKLGFPYKEATLPGQMIDNVRLKNRIDFFR
jgi:hypothetical protein